MTSKSVWFAQILVLLLASISTIVLIQEFSRVLHPTELNNSTDADSRNINIGTKVFESESTGHSSNLTARQKLIADVKRASRDLKAALSRPQENGGRIPQDSGLSFPSLSAGISIFRRGILAFVPAHNPRYISELRWFYLSWGYMRANQPRDVKSDLVLFTEPSFVAELASDFGCKLEIRSQADEDECIVLQHVPLKKRTLKEGEEASPLIDYDSYVDSMLILAEFQHTDAYDVLMRSDLDTFLTPGFSDWRLDKDVAMVTGRGGYGSTNSNKHLNWIAEKKLGLVDSGRRNLGSTWYGSSSVMKETAKLTLAVMSWLDTQEFSEYEKGNNGVDGWPYWHWPVILLYGGHIALNQIPEGRLQEYHEGFVEMDKATSVNSPMTVSTKHLHCFHGEEFFSKFKFYDGRYTDLDLSEFEAMETPQAYAAVIALSSARLSIQEIVLFSKDKEAMVSGAWKRL